MYASELMELIRKEPEKYEGKRYRVMRCHASHNRKDYLAVEVSRDHIIDNYEMTLVGVEDNKSTHDIVFMSTRTELEEIKQPVKFIEAINSGKKFKSISWSVYHPFNGAMAILSLMTVEDALSAINGDWHIED